jgi:hypothetical protein
MIFFFTKAQFEARISAKRVKRLYDDDADGNADTNPVNRLRADASAKVRSYLEPMDLFTAKIEALFDQATGELLTGKILPDEVTRLALDAAVALACQRHPEVMRQDWVKLMEQVDKDLARLRDGKTSLGGGTQGGVATPDSSWDDPTAVFPADSSATEEADRETRWGKMGDFS